MRRSVAVAVGAALVLVLVTAAWRSPRWRGGATTGTTGDPG